MTRRNPQISKKLKTLKEEYAVYDLSKRDNMGILLYEKEHRREYVATLHESGSNLVFNGTPYKTVDSLVKAIKEHNATLPFPMRCYDTMYRTNARLECGIRHYIESIGMKESRDHNIYDMRTMYVLKTATGRNVITMSIKSDFNKEGQVELMVFINKNNSLTFTIKSLDDIPKTISGLFQAFVLSEIGDVIEAMEKLNEVAPSFDGEFKRVDFKTFQVTQMPMKEYAIKRLEATLKLLKGE